MIADILSQSLSPARYLTESCLHPSAESILNLITMTSSRLDPMIWTYQYIPCRLIMPMCANNQPLFYSNFELDCRSRLHWGQGERCAFLLGQPSQWIPANLHLRYHGSQQLHHHHHYLPEAHCRPLCSYSTPDGPSPVPNFVWSTGGICKHDTWKSHKDSVGPYQQPLWQTHSLTSIWKHHSVRLPWCIALLVYMCAVGVWQLCSPAAISSTTFQRWGQRCIGQVRLHQYSEHSIRALECWQSCWWHHWFKDLVHHNILLPKHCEFWLFKVLCNPLCRACAAMVLYWADVLCQRHNQWKNWAYMLDLVHCWSIASQAGMICMICAV